MKRLLLSCLLLAGTFPAGADLIWYEGFNYANGPIHVTGTNVDGTTNWFRHSGSGNDAYIVNNRLQISATGGAVSRQDDVNRKLATVEGSAVTNYPPILLYASFTVNCTNVPSASSYFAHFMAHTNNAYYARVFARSGNLPGTWRLGISGLAGTPNQVYPVDLALNTDYQVLVQWDPVTLYSASLWVNPVSMSDPSVASSDSITSTQPSAAFAFRQGGSFGSAFFNLTNAAVATTFEEAATSVWSAAPVAPAVVYQPQSRTNFVGDAVELSAVAAGQGLGSMTYQWRKNGANILNPNGNSNVLSLASAMVSDTGNYDLTVTTPNGQSATSAAAFLWVTNPPVPPTITLQPANQTVYYGQTAQFYISATGPVPITYQWYKDNVLLEGQTETNLVVYNVRADNQTTGTYRCDVANPFGTRSSSNAVLTAIAPPSVSVGYLRTLVDPVFYLPTNTTALYTVTGIVTTHTNVTTAANSSFYMQDETGGICVYFGGNTEVRPEAGDRVTVIGPLGQFNSLLELNLTSSDPAHSVVTNSHGNLLPAGVVLPFSFTNSTAFGGPGEAIRLYQGRVVTFTNVYFPDGFAGTNMFAGNRNYTMTNALGEAFPFRVDSRVFDIIGKPIPSFAWTVTGPMGFFLGNTVPNRSSGHQLIPTRYVDIVTDAPAPVDVSVRLEGGQPELSWTAQPYLSYSVLRAAALEGPYTAVAPGLSFNTTAGHFTDTTAGLGTRFYKVVSP